MRFRDLNPADQSLAVAILRELARHPALPTYAPTGWLWVLREVEETVSEDLAAYLRPEGVTYVPFEDVPAECRPSSGAGLLHYFRVAGVEGSL